MAILKHYGPGGRPPFSPSISIEDSGERVKVLVEPCNWDHRIVCCCKEVSREKVYVTMRVSIGRKYQLQWSYDFKRWIVSQRVSTLDRQFINQPEEFVANSEITTKWVVVKEEEDRYLPHRYFRVVEIL